MNRRLPDIVEKHVIYFLTGFVAVFSTALVAFLVYLFIFVPLIFIGGYYFAIVPVIVASMYWIGKRIMREVK